jgi:hypothetical protein
LLELHPTVQSPDCGGEHGGRIEFVKVHIISSPEFGSIVAVDPEVEVLAPPVQDNVSNFHTEDVDSVIV